MAKLNLGDIVDLREYERERDGYRRSIIALKSIRRISLGNFVTVVFENRETVRFQIQEMARAEKMSRDTEIETELAIYNPLIPDKGELKATLFLELTSTEMLEEWLTKLVGIESSLYLELGLGDATKRLASRPEKEHGSQLTRDDITASVHYIEWSLNEFEQDWLKSGPAFLGVDHPNYKAREELSKATLESLVSDWV